MKKNLYLFLALLLFSRLLCAEDDVESLKKQICILRPTLEGWCSEEKALTLIDLTLELKPKVCVDIGVFGGSSLIPVAATLKLLGSGTIFGIDPWDRLECIQCFDPIRDAADFRWWFQLDYAYVYDSYIKAIKRLELEPYCITMTVTSQIAAPFIDHIDLLHIDGQHSEQGFTSDVKAFLPKVRTGGYILLNDSLWENAQPAIELLLEQCDVVKLIDGGNCMVFKKKKVNDVCVYTAAT